MGMDDNDGQMILLDLGGLKLPDICLTGEEKTRKNLTQKLVPTGDRTRARCVTSAQATTCSTAVDCWFHFIRSFHYHLTYKTLKLHNSYIQDISE